MKFRLFRYWIIREKLNPPQLNNLGDLEKRCVGWRGNVDIPNLRKYEERVDKLGEQGYDVSIQKRKIKRMRDKTGY